MMMMMTVEAESSQPKGVVGGCRLVEFEGARELIERYSSAIRMRLLQVHVDARTY